MLADPNTKPISGPTLKRKIDRIISTQYYPPEGSEHLKLLFQAPEVCIDIISTSKPSSSSFFSHFLQWWYMAVLSFQDYVSFSFGGIWSFLVSKTLYPSYLLFNPSYLSSKFSFHTFLSNL
jgi:hypothetical protein